MDARERKILHLKFGLALVKIIEERRKTAKANKSLGERDHKLISSLRKLSAASGIDFGTVQKISKGDQGLEFFTFIDLIEALGLDMASFGKYFYGVSDQEVLDYKDSIQKMRKNNKKKK